MRQFRPPKVKGLRAPKSQVLRKFRPPSSLPSGSGRQAPPVPKANALGKFHGRGGGSPRMGGQKSQASQGGPLPDQGTVQPADQQNAQPENAQKPQNGPQPQPQDQQQDPEALRQAERDGLVPSAMDRAMSGLAQADASTKSGETTPGDWKQNPAMMFI